MKTKNITKILKEISGICLPRTGCDGCMLQNTEGRCGLIFGTSEERYENASRLIKERIERQSIYSEKENEYSSAHKSCNSLDQ